MLKCISFPHNRLGVYMQSPSTLISYLLNIDRDGLLTIEGNIVDIGIDLSKYSHCDFFSIDHPDFYVYRLFTAIVSSDHLFSDLGVTVTFLGRSLDIHFKGPDELDFMDTIKLIDMLITDSFPSQVVAHYREVGDISSKSALRARKIVFSDGQSSICLLAGGVGWSLSADGNSSSRDIDAALRQLNASFFSARHAEFFQGQSLLDP